jgi:hypothetical protein
VTTDLKYLVYTAMLTAALWIPYIVCQVRTNGPLQPSNYADPGLPRPVPPWGQCSRHSPPLWSQHIWPERRMR